MKCAKCESNDNYKEYHKSGYDCGGTDHNRRSSEHLHFYCKECQFDWVTDTKDKKK